MDDQPRDRRGRRRPGRIEAALDLDLRQAPELAKAVRASLRALAGAMDKAERDGDLDQLTRTAHEFHDQLAAAGIALPPVAAIDELDAFIASLGRPGPGAGDPAR